jgi:hypothetical protein
MMKKVFSKITFAMALILGTGLFSGQALAASTGTTTVSQGINPGTMDVSATPTATFSAVTLDGTTKTTTANPGALNVQDNTGAGAGWKVAVSASQMTEQTPTGGFATGTTAEKLPKGSLNLSNSGATISQNGTTSPAPTWKGANFTIDSGTPVNILSAAVDQGMGKYVVTFGSTALALTLNPNTTYTDPTNYPSGSTPYSTVLTYTITTGP